MVNCLFIFSSLILIIGISFFYLRSNPKLSFVYDDSYITLQFAKNFFDKRGLTFDGEHYNLGATSPFHIFLLAVFNLLFQNLHFTAIFVGILSLILLSYFTFLYAKTLFANLRISLLTSFLTITTGWLYFDALSGLETILFIILMVLTLYLLEKRKPLYSLTLGLAILTRPEGWFLLLSILSFLLFRFFQKKDINLVREIILPFSITILVVSPYLFSNLKTTGNFLPNTAMSKTLFFGDIGLPIKRKLELFLIGLKIFYLNLAYPIFPIIFIFPPFARKCYKRFYFVIFFFLFYIFYFFLFPGSTIHYWGRYQHIFYPFLILLVAEGFYNLSRKFRKNKLFLNLLFLLLIGLNQVLSLLLVEKKYRYQINSTEEVLVRLANYFKEKSPPDAVVATHDIGMLGYYSERKILDLVGLVNPEMAKFYRKENTNNPIPLSQRDIFPYVKEKGDFLVIFDFFERFLNFDPDALPNDFIFLEETKPVYGLNQSYRVYGILK